MFASNVVIMGRYSYLLFYLSTIVIFGGFGYVLVLQGQGLEQHDILAASTGPALSAGIQASTSALALLLVQLLVIICCARLLCLLFRNLGQPSVMGEIIA